MEKGGHPLMEKRWKKGGHPLTLTGIWHFKLEDFWHSSIFSILRQSNWKGIDIGIWVAGRCLDEDKLKLL
jgi:hypothetical protein